MYALAVSEENAAGGRVVTARLTVRAALFRQCWLITISSASGKRAVNCPLFSGSGGNWRLYKMNASISGAEVGCQGEIGWPVQWRRQG